MPCSTCLREDARPATRTPTAPAPRERQAVGQRDKAECAGDERALLLAISHELRSPLTRARVNAELVPEGEHRDALLRDLSEMRDLITGLLESERLAVGHAALQTERVDLAALARELVATQFSDAGLVLQLDDTLGLVSADPKRVRLLLRNLIDNALRHSAGAPQSPVVSLSREAGGALRLAVRDFGPGVSDEQLAHLAEPLYRLDSARQRAASASACTCAGWLGKRMAARCSSATPSRG